MICSPQRGTTRTLDKVFKQIGTWIRSEQASIILEVFRRIKQGEFKPNPPPEPDPSIESEEDDYQWVKIAV